jgi:hypothetical protein
MKNNKQKKIEPRKNRDEVELVKPKKKLLPNDSKIKVRSKKFWEELYDNEGEELEKYTL